MLILRVRLGLDDRDVRLTNNLYYQQKTAVRIEDDLTDMVNIKRGMQQGCVLSLNLFTLYEGVIQN